jgi:predicted cobalt transporter CbtA
MTSSWKIGAFSGLVAGIVWGIVNSFIVISFLNLGLPYSYYEPPNVTPLTEIFLFEIIFNTVFGIIFALIFSKIYEAIPGKSHALKGLFFGLGLYFLICIRSIIFLYSYGLIILVLNLLFTISPII